VLPSSYADDLPAQLVGDAAQGTLLPTFLTNATTYNPRNQTLTWEPLTPGWDGFSLLVDDVERYAGAALNFSLAGLQAGIPHFFRLAVRVVSLLRSMGCADRDGSIRTRGPMVTTRWRRRCGLTGRGSTLLRERAEVDLGMHECCISLYMWT
jgi:hypothetical protein